MTASRRLVVALSLLAGPPVLLLAGQQLNWVAAASVAQTLTGIAVTAVGGLLAGMVSERFLRRGRNGFEQTAGVVVTALLGVTTIGIFYLLYIRGPVSSIGTPERATKQLFGFIEFLSAQGAGILLSALWSRKP